MSRRWTAKCWMGTNSGYVDIEVGASSFAGAKEQLQRVYGAQQIVNLREIRSNSGSGGISVPSGGGTWLVGLLAGGALLLYFTPWILMLLYGASGAWVAQKVTGQTLQDYSELDESETTEQDHKKALVVAVTALFLGGAGFIHGTAWNTELNKEYNLDGKQPTVEQVRQK